jgi:hypothetical protein
LPDSANTIIQQEFDKQFPQGFYGEKDTSVIKRMLATQEALEAIQQHRLFNDSARFKTIYLSTDSRRGLYPFTLPPASQPAEIPDAFVRINSRINSLFSQVVPSDTSVAMQQLNALQSSVYPADFQLCTAKITSRPSNRKRPFDWDITTVSFSKIVFNATQTKALLRYDMNCGGKCGFGEILLVEKVNGNWHIKQAEQLWIS